MTTFPHRRRYRGACLLPLLLASGCTRPAADVAVEPPGPAGASTSAPASASPPAQGETARYRSDAVAAPGLALPADIARALGTDERVLSCAEGTRDGVSQFAPDWVAVRRIDLDDDGRGDWIVNGRHDCLRDGSAAAWWVYADTASVPRLLLAGAEAVALEVLPTRTGGFRDLRLQRADGEVALRYDGSVYPLPAQDPTPQR